MAMIHDTFNFYVPFQLFIYCVRIFSLININENTTNGWLRVLRTWEMGWDGNKYMIRRTWYGTTFVWFEWISMGNNIVVKLAYIWWSLETVLIKPNIAYIDICDNSPRATFATHLGTSTSYERITYAVLRTLLNKSRPRAQTQLDWQRIQNIRSTWFRACLLAQSLTKLMSFIRNLLFSFIHKNNEIQIQDSQYRNDNNNNLTTTNPMYLPDVSPSPCGYSANELKIKKINDGFVACTQNWSMCELNS